MVCCPCVDNTSRIDPCWLLDPKIKPWMWQPSLYMDRCPRVTLMGFAFVVGLAGMRQRLLQINVHVSVACFEAFHQLNHDNPCPQYLHPHSSHVSLTSARVNMLLCPPSFWDDTNLRVIFKGGYGLFHGSHKSHGTLGWSTGCRIWSACVCALYQHGKRFMSCWTFSVIDSIWYQTVLVQTCGEADRDAIKRHALFAGTELSIPMLSCRDAEAYHDYVCLVLVISCSITVLLLIWAWQWAWLSRPNLADESCCPLRLRW